MQALFTQDVRRAVVTAVAILTCLGAGTAAAQDESAGDLFSQGVELFHNKDYRDASDVFRRVFAIDPNPFVLYNIGRCYQELGELEIAVKYYDQALHLGELPRDAKVEAIRRLDAIQTALEVRSVREDSGRRLWASLAKARADLGAAEAALLPATPAVATPPPTPGNTQEGMAEGTLTWVGIAVGALGITALSGGVYFAVQAGDDLAQQRRRVDDFRQLEDQALTTGDPFIAAQALATAEEANRMASDVEQSQRLSVALFAAGGAMLIGGAVMVLADDEAAETDVTVILTTDGFAVTLLW